MSSRFCHITPTIFTVLLLSAVGLFAQQDALFTQVYFDKITVNPAYTGARDHLSLTALYRDQWTGLDGSPQTASLSLHGPLASDRIALGFQFTGDDNGLISQTGLLADFAWRLPIGKGILSMGINGGITNYSTNIGDAFIVSADDPVFTADRNLWLPNVGFGLYYYLPRFYFGLSAPHLIDNRLDKTSSATGGAQSPSQYRHYYLMSGVIIGAGHTLKLRPNLLLRYADQATFQAEGNLSLLFVERIWIGAGYRSGASWMFNLEVQATEMLRFGYSYDLVGSQLSGQTNGSHEVLVGFDFGGKTPPVSSPRNFVPSYF